jgi:uncharacterized membrane protein YkvA (DUF1232 family)
MSRSRFIPDWKGIWSYLKNPKTDWKPKALVVVVIVYMLWPVDLLPDLIPFIGWLDDLGFVSLAGWVLIKVVSKTPTLKD